MTDRSAQSVRDILPKDENGECYLVLRFPNGDIVFRERDMTFTDKPVGITHSPNGTVNVGEVEDA